MDSEYSVDLYDDTIETAPRAPRQRRSDGRERHTYRTLRAIFRSQCAARQEPCWLSDLTGCDGIIDYRLTHPDPDAFELDHYIPVVTDPSLEMQPSNWRASHSRCTVPCRGRQPSRGAHRPQGAVHDIIHHGNQRRRQGVGPLIEV